MLICNSLKNRTGVETQSGSEGSDGVMDFQRKALFRNKAFIGGRWVEADAGAVFSVCNPADLSEIARVPDMGAAETLAAVDAASAAFPVWRALTGKERALILMRWFLLICEHADDLAAILTAEQGKALAEARGEVLSGAAFVEWFAEEAKRVYGDYIPAHKADARIVVSREPVGVVGAITPWNFPSSMITRKASAALAAGCTVVLKPAEDTPLSALALAALAEEAGFPPGVFNVVTASLEKASKVGAVLSGDARVRKLSFTGSTEVGKILMRQAAENIQKVSLELGGNAPFIVFESADIEAALAGVMASKFRNAGQTCISANRIYVHESLYAEFTERLTGLVRDLRTGPGNLGGVQMGPLINREALEKVESLVQDAVMRGAVVETGGAADNASLGGAFYMPTVLSRVPDDARMCAEEIFGPVAALYPFGDDMEVIERANATEYGLACYIYSNDQRQIWRVSEALAYGMVSVNEPLLTTELAPFGGMKRSGMGREGGKYGLQEFTEMKYKLLGGL